MQSRYRSGRNFYRKSPGLLPPRGDLSLACFRAARSRNEPERVASRRRLLSETRVAGSIVNSVFCIQKGGASLTRRRSSAPVFPGGQRRSDTWRAACKGNIFSARKRTRAPPPPRREIVSNATPLISTTPARSYESSAARANDN